MIKYKVSDLIVLLFGMLFLFGIVGCVSQKTSTAPTTPGQTAPATPTISPIDLGLIQTAATVATGAVLQFAESSAANRTALANEIYSSANAANSLSTGNIPTPDQINNTILSFAGSNPAAQYTVYATSLSGLYKSYFGKIGTNGANAIAVLQAIAAGAQAGASAYITVPAPAQ